MTTSAWATPVNQCSSGARRGAAVERCDVGVLRPPARLDQAQRDRPVMRRCQRQASTERGIIVRTQYAGQPARVAPTRSGARVTAEPPRARAGMMATASVVASVTIVRHSSARPSVVGSKATSADHTSFGAARLHERLTVHHRHPLAPAPTNWHAFLDVQPMHALRVHDLAGAASPRATASAACVRSRARSGALRPTRSGRTFSTSENPYLRHRSCSGTRHRLTGGSPKSDLR